MRSSLPAHQSRGKAFCDPELRIQFNFNRNFREEGYASLLALLDRCCGVRVEFRVAETPIFVPLAMLEEMAPAGVDLTRRLIGANPILPLLTAQFRAVIVFPAKHPIHTFSPQIFLSSAMRVAG